MQHEANLVRFLPVSLVVHFTYDGLEAGPMFSGGVTGPLGLEYLLFYK